MKRSPDEDTPEHSFWKNAQRDLCFFNLSSDTTDLQESVQMREEAPQGGVISPTFFLLYINNITNVLPRRVFNILQVQLGNTEEKKNVVQFARNHQRCFHIQHASKPVFKNSFFARTIREWNNLNSSVVSAGTVGEFKTLLLRSSQRK